MRRPTGYGVASLVALAVAVGSLVGALPARDPGTLVLSPAAPAGAAAPGAPPPVTRPSPVVRPSPVAHSRPVHLTIPALGISTAVGLLGLQSDGQVMVPTTVHTVGWFRDGPTPGVVGSAVILGHVDSYRGPGIFFELKTMRTGDVIRVTLADHVVLTFVVTRVVQFAKTHFPDRLVYGPHGTRSLNLVTCGGVFNHATGSYESNVVVFSTMLRAS
ncbi:MAG: sortase domain-containing protein [Acidimicrobiales bacterium]